MDATTSLLDEILGSLGDKGLDRLSREADLPREKTATASEAAIAAILHGLQRNAARPEGADALAKALRRDHPGDDVDLIEEYFRNADVKQKDGTEILGHVFGDRRERVETRVGKATGIDVAQMAKIFATLAPIVMGMLGKQQRKQDLDPGGLGDLLRRHGETTRQRSSKSTGILDAILDADHDGDVDLGDLTSILGKLRG